jgi:beta-glucosidase
VPGWENIHNSLKNNVIDNQKIIFIGDSITDGWDDTGLQAWNDLKARYNNKLTNLGISGDRIPHVIWRLLNGEFPEGINPEYVVLMIGTNNVSNGELTEAIAVGIAEIIYIISDISPDTRILLCSLLPRGSGSTDAASIKCNNVNEIIKNYNGYLNVTYVNLAPIYLNGNGSLKNELFTDTLHLNLAGYELWKARLIEIIGD